MAGARPIVDIVFLDMIMEAMGQIVEQAATIHYTSNGRIRGPCDSRGDGNGAQHWAAPLLGRCFDLLVCAYPGIEGGARSSIPPEDVKGSMKDIIRYVWSGYLLYRVQGSFTYKKVPVSHGLVHASGFWQSQIVRAGTDATIVAMSPMVGSRPCRLPKYYRRKAFPSK